MLVSSSHDFNGLIRGQEINLCPEPWIKIASTTPIPKQSGRAEALLGRGARLLSELTESLDIVYSAGCHIKVCHQAVGQRIDPAVDAKFLAPSPSFLYKDV
jgi:hypothetical protein